MFCGHTVIAFRLFHLTAHIMVCIFVDTKGSHAKTLTQNAEPQPTSTRDISIHDTKWNESKVTHRGQRK